MTDQERIQQLEAENHHLRMKLHDRHIRECEEHLSNTCARFSNDLTGQDGEQEKWDAAHDLIAARDDKLREEDPCLYSELRAMGQLR